MYQIYCDGSCKGNGQEQNRGGWAFIILEDNNIICSKKSGVKDTTNQRMELVAAIEALRATEEQNLLGQIEIYTDSAYLCNCKIQQWYKQWQIHNWCNSKKQPVANIDLWKQLIPFFEQSRFVFIKVKGHSDNNYNTLVDKMAVQGAENI